MRIDNPLLVSTVGRVCGGAFRLLFGTLRKDLQISSHACPYSAAIHAPRMLYSVWHDSTILAAFGGKHTHTVALTSCHRDGAFVASILATIGVGTVRGSSGKSGGVAARRLIDVAATHDIVITPDGPRGPRRTMSRGIVYLASKSGNPIVPTAFSSTDAWEVPGRWTTQTIPKPFSRISLVAGEPVWIPPRLNRCETESYRVQLQGAMDKLQRQADLAIQAHSVQGGMAV